MVRVSPLHQSHVEAEASFLSWGAREEAIDVVETFGDPPIEYASIRKACALLDEPHLGVLDLTGADRLDFLGRLLTQRTSDAPEWTTRHAFALNRKGRIEADMTLLALPQRVLAVLDAADAQALAAMLAQFLFTEDVEITDRTDEMHRLSLHGPGAPSVLRSVADPVEGPGLLDLTERRATLVRLAGHRVVIERDDETAAPGFHLLVPAEGVTDVYNLLLETNGQASDDLPRVRPVGWAAYNTARIEGGRVLFRVDFGPDSLPHETGVLHDRVTFDQRCYLGQEVVARMESRGRPKRRLVSLDLDPDGPRDAEGMPIQPVTGSHVLPGSANEQDADAVGAVTSSTLSPMLGGRPICFAMVKTDLADPGTDLLVEAESHRLRARVRSELRFWTRPES